MRADNEFLIALIGKLTEIMENTADVDTASELSEFIDVITDSLR
jgi:hypothetical protein